MEVIWVKIDMHRTIKEEHYERKCNQLEGLRKTEI